MLVVSILLTVEPAVYMSAAHLPSVNRLLDAVFRFLIPNEIEVHSERHIPYDGRVTPGSLLKWRVALIP